MKIDILGRSTRVSLWTVPFAFATHCRSDLFSRCKEVSSEPKPLVFVIVFSFCILVCYGFSHICTVRSPIWKAEFDVTRSTSRLSEGGTGLCRRAASVELREEGNMSVQRGRVCILVGMAGSGKTSLLERLVDFTHAAGKSSYVINLDPAAHNLPYQANTIK